MPGTRAAVARLLAGPSMRTERWPAFVVVALLAGTVVRQGGRNGDDPSTIALPIATTLLGGWLCFAFEDAAAQVTSPSPTPLTLRRAVRASIAVVAATLAWFAYTWIGPLDGPTWPMTAMFAGVALVALACAALSARVIASDRSGIAAVFGVVGVTVALPFVLALAFGRPTAIDPSRVPVGDPGSYWATVAAVAVVALVLAHRDPALPGPVAWVRSRPGHPRPSHAAPVRESR
jgi:hypothetical protein